MAANIKSKDIIHCCYCAPCKCPSGPASYLARDTFEKKCTNAMRRDNLQRHCGTQHGGKTKRALGDFQHRSVTSIFQPVTAASKIVTGLSKEMEEESGDGEVTQLDKRQTTTSAESVSFPSVSEAYPGSDLEEGKEIPTCSIHNQSVEEKHDSLMN